MLTDLKITEFLDRLASDSPTPGGGSAGALAGAVGSALGLMTLRFSKIEGDKVEDRLEELRREFSEFVDRDAEAYDRVTAAFKMPKGNPEEKKARKAAIQEALYGAAVVPLEGVRRCAEALQLLDGFAERSNPNLSSDLASGAVFLGAAAQIMAKNVAINVSSIKDPERAARLQKDLDAALEDVNRTADTVLSKVEKLGA